jgi:hypothetical protein
MRKLTRLTIKLVMSVHCGKTDLAASQPRGSRPVFNPKRKRSQTNVDSFAFGRYLRI